MLKSGYNIDYKIHFVSKDDVIDFEYLYLVIPKEQNPKLTYSKIVECYPNDSLYETMKDFIVKVKVDYPDHYESVILPMLCGKYS